MMTRISKSQITLRKPMGSPVTANTVHGRQVMVPIKKEKVKRLLKRPRATMMRVSVSIKTVEKKETYKKMALNSKRTRCLAQR
jgi:hypothetical protein